MQHIQCCELQFLAYVTKNENNKKVLHIVICLFCSKQMVSIGLDAFRHYRRFRRFVKRSNHNESFAGGCTGNVQQFAEPLDNIMKFSLSINNVQQQFKQCYSTIQIISSEAWQFVNVLKIFAGYGNIRQRGNIWKSQLVISSNQQIQAFVS